MKERRNKYGINPETGERFKAQWEVILFYLREKKGRSITSMEAITEFGFTRLSGIVKQIEYRANIVLSREAIVVPTRYGGAVRVARYWYEKAE